MKGFSRKMDWRWPMKPLSLFSIPILLLGFGALMLFSPNCKVQSEVNADHFDGTDVWELAAACPHR